MEAEKQLVDAYRKKLELLKKCHQIMEEKTVILMSNHLTRLEKSLEAETYLQNELMEQEKKIQRRKRELAAHWQLEEAEVDWRTLSMRLKGAAALEINELRAALRLVVEGIRTSNFRNLALIENGQLFVGTLLTALFPQPTYQADLMTRPPQLPSRLSMEC
jgi:flagellar biosynthesis/type III secretory pathway chaperone